MHGMEKYMNTKAKHAYCGPKKPKRKNCGKRKENMAKLNRTKEKNGTQMQIREENKIALQTRLYLRLPMKIQKRITKKNNYPDQKIKITGNTARGGGARAVEEGTASLGKRYTANTRKARLAHENPKPLPAPERIAIRIYWHVREQSRNLKPSDTSSNCKLVRHIHI